MMKICKYSLEPLLSEFMTCVLEILVFLTFGI